MTRCSWPKTRNQQEGFQSAQQENWATRQKRRLSLLAKIQTSRILQTGKDNSSVILEITKDRERAISIIRQMADIEVDSVMEHQIKIRHPGDDEKMNRFLIELLQQGVVLDGYHRQQDNLEQMFMQLTGNSGESGN